MTQTEVDILCKCYCGCQREYENDFLVKMNTLCHDCLAGIHKPEDETPESLDLDSFIEQLREVPFWSTKGEPFLGRLIKWTVAQDLTQDNLDAIIAYLCSRDIAHLKAKFNYTALLLTAWRNHWIRH